MNKLILFALALSLSGCSTMIVKKWSVDNDKMAKFNEDTLICQEKAHQANTLAGGYSNTYERVLDYCLQQRGYKLEISKETEWGI